MYDRKNTLVAADMLNDKVLPFYTEQQINLLRILTDRGTQYCGAREHHHYQLYLTIEDIDHSKTGARSPQTNGICERFHRTMQEEFYAIAFRKKMYNSWEELQTDIDCWINYYNEERPQSGRYCFSKTPIQTFKDSKDLARQKDIQQIFYKSLNFNPSSEAEMSNAGKQLIRNSLTDGNEKAVDGQSTAFLPTNSSLS